HWNDCRHRSEDLFLSDPHGGLHISKYSRLMEAALAQLAILADTAAKNQLGAFLLADLDIVVDALQLLFIDDRSDVIYRIQTVAQAELLGASDEFVDELFVAALVHDHAAGCSTALPGGTERAPYGSFNHEIHVGVFHYADGILAAQFARRALHELPAA